MQCVIFGTNDFASLAHYYIGSDFVAAFTVNKEYLKEDEFEEKPVVAFEELNSKFPPYEYYLFAPLADNILREKIYQEGQMKGYRFMNYVSPKANVNNVKVGENCFILENNNIQPYVEIGNNVILWSGNHIGHHSVIEDNVFIASHVVVSGHCTIKSYCWLGVNSTIKDGITLAEGTVVGMCAGVMKDTKPNGVYIGVPAVPKTVWKELLLKPKKQK